MSARYASRMWNAKKPVAIYDVIGVGEPYNIYLPTEVEVLQRLERAIPIEYTVLEEKFAGRTLFGGEIVSTSTEGVGAIPC